MAVAGFDQVQMIDEFPSTIVWTDKELIGNIMLK